VSNETESQSDPIVIKKYANRRLYNTDTSSYVTLDDLAEMVRAERDFSVHDAKTGEDLTHAVLTQIIVDQESKGQNLLPIGFLRQLIRFYGDSIEKLVPSYLEFSLDKLTSRQDQYRKQMEDAFGVLPLDAVQDQARMNFAMFEKALGMFKPFNAAMGSAEAANQGGKPGSGSAGAAADAGAKSAGAPGDIEALKAEMTAMQDKLDKLSRNRS